ncbi:Chlorophyll a-b binding protein [Monoraphidium neglectum]|uniref:Chlorophyll a-b binding protein, chloroplastic n=1 Tax=Monoraphidium neglectum TaxID=145388 RepID=A0A0D2MY35_9CHLO|nr:Chlorophyll a-b binding protein [Monoraphidium neglectum]KIZ07395.1 Chlorophyll a-b binding protein [Monoraphidium neglectum]|eukprot:XP_013906414.1 Chlorophyll a-b binding protein [Monoraphidium neglectum]
MSMLHKQALGRSGVSARASRSRSVVVRAERALWAPGVVAPAWLDGSLPGDRGFDPAGLGADPKALAWHRQAELVHGRWAMLGAAGVLGQEILNPSINWYTEAALPQNLPAPFTNVNFGGLLAIEFLLMHWVEVRRWQDIRKFGSVNEDPIFKGNSVPNLEPGYPGGIFDPLGFSKGNLKELQTKEIKNGRLAMIAWIGFAFQAQTTGKGPLASLAGHLSDPAGDNWLTNIGTCAIPKTVDVQGLSIPTTCLWPAAN